MKEKIQNRDLKITIVGMGYIGLPTAITFANAGFKVYGFDVNENVINTLKNGKIHIVEPDLQEAYEEALNSGNLKPTNKLDKSDIFIICVPTPFKKNEKEKVADLSYVKSASEMVSKYVEKGNLVILESTVPPKTTEEVMGKIIEKNTNLKINADFYVAHCPERVLPGKILYELENNDRIIGASNKYAEKITKELYETILKNGKVYTTDTITAEMCKLVENTYRDINIAFANELSIISDKLGINVFELIELANKHPRVNILKPGAGVGGHCLAVDPWFIVEKFQKEANLIRTAREINDYKPHYIVEKIEKEVEYDKNKIIGILGLAYKPNIDDLRESPSLEIALNLKKKGYTVYGCEPYSKEKNIKGIENISFEEIVEKSDYLVLTLSHNQFLEKIDLLKYKNVFDVIGIINEKYNKIGVETK
ncbi:UDP-N-acetyl-D-mannosaminuronic acid dehydrogenase [Marinitoga hydrogenitolerans DSM 16785]|uniref:UDP-N-acetyl-D-mannosaminuronic acid dehydrogenase n=1 Tax=Marinitoga hydrogenitolerans (strain DSM 16785 / JCM 12826 / AT1271) TaxID=1122195 RepID=A0A1M4YX79_MARH1|nr:nucleotide sugar dehydrogenase [Marinitoga hydrogenitolerans]SHF10393.1 UDP-N-acetyl-D-mannosaminuronic acid dehydrogenase [Marinitoga hydrogenitolerans DSM 16785]